MKKKYLLVILFLVATFVYGEDKINKNFSESLIGLWKGIDLEDNSIKLKKSNLGENNLEIEFFSINPQSGNMGSFEGEIIFSSGEIQVKNSDGKKLGNLRGNYFIKSDNNEIVGSIKKNGNMLFFQNFTNLCEVGDFSSCGMGVELKEGYFIKSQ